MSFIRRNGFLTRLENAILTESKDRKISDKKSSSQIAETQTQISAEVANRVIASENLQSQIDDQRTLGSSLLARVDSLEGDVNVLDAQTSSNDEDILNLQTELTAETSNRQGADSALQSQINDQQTQTSSLQALAQTQLTRVDSLEGNVNALETQTTSNSVDILNLQTANTAEIQARQQGDSSLQAQITPLQTTTVKNPVTANVDFNFFEIKNAIVKEIYEVKAIRGPNNGTLSLISGSGGFVSISNGGLDLGANRIGSIGAPIFALDAANKQFVEGLVNNNRIYYNSALRTGTFHTSANSGTTSTGTLSFERQGNQVSLVIPIFNVRVGTAPVPYIEVLNAFPYWALPDTQGLIFPIVIHYRGAPVLGRIQLAGTSIRFFRSLDNADSWVEAKGGEIAQHGLIAKTTITYNASPYKLPPTYSSTTTVGSDFPDPGDFQPTP